MSRDVTQVERWRGGVGVDANATVDIVLLPAVQAERRYHSCPTATVQIVQPTAAHGAERNVGRVKMLLLSTSCAAGVEVSHNSVSLVIAD